MMKTCNFEVNGVWSNQNSEEPSASQKETL